MGYIFIDDQLILDGMRVTLLEKGWKVIEHLVEKSQITYGFEAYDTTLLVPNANFVKDAGFMVF